MNKEALAILGSIREGAPVSQNIMKLREALRHLFWDLSKLDKDLNDPVKRRRKYAKMGFGKTTKVKKI